MEPIEFEVTLTDEVFVARAGLPLVGQLLSRTQLHERIDGLKVAGAANPTIGHGDVALSMTGLLCLGRPDYAAIEAEQPMELLPLSLGLRGLPSEETLRQRLDQIGASCLDETMAIVQDESAALVGAWAGPLTPCWEHGRDEALRRWVALDIDVAPFDNGDTKKQGVSRTYKGVDGYAPIFAYLGEAGYLVNAALREGSQHSQKDAVGFIARSLDLARSVVESTDNGGEHHLQALWLLGEVRQIIEHDNPFPVLIHCLPQAQRRHPLPFPWLQRAVRVRPCPLVHLLKAVGFPLRPGGMRAR